MHAHVHDPGSGATYIQPNIGRCVGCLACTRRGLERSCRTHLARRSRSMETIADPKVGVLPDREAIGDQIAMPPK